MGKLDYLDALKRGMIGLAPELQAKTLAHYEQRFVDAAAAGRGEEELARELDDPAAVARSLRQDSQAPLVREKPNPARALRVVAAATGLAIVNLFMLAPAAVCGALLAAVYALAFAFYVGGIAITATGLAGVSELQLNLPHVVIDDEGRAAGMTHVSIGQTGIEVYHDRPAQAMSDRAIHISTDMDAGSRSAHTMFGLGMVLGGIALFLAGLVVTRRTIGCLKRYIQMNVSLLKGD
jgi:uncharacterized membrane protein